MRQCDVCRIDVGSADLCDTCAALNEDVRRYYRERFYAVVADAFTRAPRRAEPVAAEAGGEGDERERRWIRRYRLLKRWARDVETRLGDNEDTILDLDLLTNKVVALEARLATLEQVAGYGQRAERGEGEARRG